MDKTWDEWLTRGIEKAEEKGQLLEKMEKAVNRLRDWGYDVRHWDKITLGIKGKAGRNEISIDVDGIVHVSILVDQVSIEMKGYATIIFAETGIVEATATNFGAGMRFL